MGRFAVTVAVIFLLSSCSNGESKKGFTVKGTVENNTAVVIYLEEVPASMMQPKLVDSAKLEKDGKFSLHADSKESVVYNLRLDQNVYPVASIINDAPEVILDIKLSKENSKFAESYEVKGSAASQKMKDFLILFNNDLQKIFYTSIYADSLNRAGASDSLLLPIQEEQITLTRKIRDNTLSALDKANDPSLILFELGYYQSTANGSGFGLEPLENEKVSEIVSRAAQKFPSHTGIASVHQSLTAEIEKITGVTWVGKEAPDFSLPDINGNEVKLSSFRGKYVLVDFWASWCQPCRMENPNVVKIYEEYKDKNFTVLGVSLDRPGQKNAWLKAIKDDGLTWTQVSDLKFWESSVVSLYRFGGIPFNVLVDPGGKVIGEGLRGSALEAKLKESLK